jgi:hypothetical protein
LKFVNEKISAKILQEARKQQSELQDEYEMGDHGEAKEAKGEKTQKKTTFVLKPSMINTFKKIQLFQITDF